MRGILVICLALSSLSFGNGQVDRGLVWVGGQLRTAAFLGTLEAMEKSGNAPDLIFATCGGSLGAIIAHTIPKAEDRKKFITSAPFKKFIESVEINPQTLKRNLQKEITPLISAFVNRKQKPANKIPNIFQTALLDIPTSSGLDWDKAVFTSAKPRIVVLGARVLFQPNQAGKTIDPLKEKLYKMVYMTDPLSALLFQNAKLDLAKDYPMSFAMADTEVNTQAKLYEASRASMAEPYISTPGKIGEDYYLSGSMDSYPFELARRLSKELWVTASGAQGFVEEIGFYDAFAIPINERRKKAHESMGEYIIDFTDLDSLDEKSRLGPYAKLNGFSIELKKDKIDQEEFNRRVMAQYDFGYERVLEALLKSPQDPSVLRKF